MPILTRISAMLLVTLGVALAVEAPPRVESPFDDGWRFHRGDVPGAEAADFDDQAWRTVDVPHDWSIEDLPAEAATARPILDLSRGTWLFQAGDDPAWKDPSFDDGRWQAVKVPGNWEEHGNTSDNTYGWYRRRFDLPEGVRGKDVILLLGCVDDVDETFVNGEKVGGLGSFPPRYATAWNEERMYTVPASLLKGGGRDLVAVRVFDSQGAGGMNAAAVPGARSGPFDSKLSQGGVDTGWVVGGTGWYRRRFALPDLAPDRRVEICFDGVYMDCDLWLNGRHVGSHPHGYTGFAFDATPFLRSQGENILAVRVRNEGRNSRWYSGSGIYRHVLLAITGPVRVPLWGLFVTTPEVTARKAVVRARVEMASALESAVDATVAVALLDPDGRSAAKGETKASVPGRGESAAAVELGIDSPRLWSPDSPSLYSAVAEIRVAGRVADRVVVAFGIRRVEIDAERGFRLNGEPLELKGGCLHHDNGPLGSAAIDRAEERRVEILKAAGYNSIRTSHNPPSSAFLDACDRAGMLVMDEAFDMWETAKKPEDYHRFFAEHGERDMTSMVRRDRNHPSVFAWSIGNEIPERADPAGVAIAARLRAAALAHDATRPITAAICHFWDHPGRTWLEGDPAFVHLDLAGYNYLWREYEKDHARHPARVIAGTETFPLEAFENWDQVERHAYVIGDFVWTAWDYLGESGIGRAWIEGEEPGGFLGPWPWHISGCGDIDILGFRKPWSYYRESSWRPGVLWIAVHRPLAPGQKEKVSQWGWPDVRSHWTWPGQEAKPLKVAVYSSCERVSLTLNGRKIGEKPTTRAEKYRAEFDVPYEPGELAARGEMAGKPPVEAKLRTAKRPAALRLSADRTSIRAGRDDLCYALVELVDADGTLVPEERPIVRAFVTGAGEIAAMANADPVDVASYRGPSRKVYQGVCQVILRPNGWPGTIALTVASEGLPPATLMVTAK